MRGSVSEWFRVDGWNILLLISIFSFNSCLHLSPSNFLFYSLFVRCTPKKFLWIWITSLYASVCVHVWKCFSYADQSTSRCILVLSRTLKLHYNQCRYSEYARSIVWNPHLNSSSKWLRAQQLRVCKLLDALAVEKLVGPQLLKRIKWNILISAMWLNQMLAPSQWLDMENGTFTARVEA